MEVARMVLDERNLLKPPMYTGKVLATVAPARPVP
jgi:hypothetical protein